MNRTISSEKEFCLWILFQALRLTHSLLLSDLPTPSFIIDVDVLQKRTTFTVLPKLFLPKYNTFVEPTPLSTIHDEQLSLDIVESPVYVADFSVSGRALGYLHSKVIAIKKGNETFLESTYISELDLKPSMCHDPDINSKAENTCWARLVQGLSNDGVGTYYWARSTGLGCSMMANGVLFGDKCSDMGLLRCDGTMIALMVLYLILEAIPMMGNEVNG